MAATMSDVAKLAGVSVKSVSNYHNGYPYMTEETKAKIAAAVAALNYRLNVSARNLRSGKTGMIGLVIPELDQAYFAELAQSVITEAQGLGLNVFVETTGASREHELEILSGARSQMADGIIFGPRAVGSADAEHIEVDFPLVLIGDPLLAGPVDHVTMANTAGADLAVVHLLSRGRRRIAAIGAYDAPEGSAPVLRRKGYAAALERAGVAMDRALLAPTRAWHRPSGAEVMARLLDDRRDIDAVFCFNDALALGALRELLRRGVRVPDDVAVVGFDNTEDARFSTPSLTTIDPGRDMIARAAVQLLHKQITAHRRPDGQRVTAEFSLVVRESTA